MVLLDNNTWLLGNKCWPGYLTSEQSEYNNNNNNKTDILPG